jgi:hypothetical protein
MDCQVPTRYGVAVREGADTRFNVLATAYSSHALYSELSAGLDQLPLAILAEEDG